MQLLIGQISYLNSQPFYPLLGEHRLVAMPPRELGRLAERGEIDAGIMATADYLSLEDRYQPAADLGIANHQEVRSILLYARRPLSELGGTRIGITEETSTSIFLLRLLLEARQGIRPADYVRGLRGEGDAFLLIGNEALRGRRRPPARMPPPSATGWGPRKSGDSKGSSPSVPISGPGSRWAPPPGRHEDDRRHGVHPRQSPLWGARLDRRGALSAAGCFHSRAGSAGGAHSATAEARTGDHLCGGHQPQLYERVRCRLHLLCLLPPPGSSPSLYVLRRRDDGEDRKVGRHGSHHRADARRREPRAALRLLPRHGPRGPGTFSRCDPSFLVGTGDPGDVPDLGPHHPGSAGPTQRGRPDHPAGGRRGDSIRQRAAQDLAQKGRSGRLAHRAPRGSRAGLSHHRYGEVRPCGDG